MKSYYLEFASCNGHAAVIYIMFTLLACHPNMG